MTISNLIHQHLTHQISVERTHQLRQYKSYLSSLFAAIFYQIIGDQDMPVRKFNKVKGMNRNRYREKTRLKYLPDNSYGAHIRQVTASKILAEYFSFPWKYTWEGIHMTTAHKTFPLWLLPIECPHMRETPHIICCLKSCIERSVCI